MNKTYYQKLRLDENASVEEIKIAYKKLAIKYHRMKKDGDEQCKINFQEINSIYEILIDPISKREYDRALKIKRERIKQSRLKREQILRKRRYERNYFSRYASKPATPEYSSIFKFLYHHIGPIGLFFILYFAIGVVGNAFDKPKNISFNKTVNLDSIVHINASLEEMQQGFFVKGYER